MGGGVASVNAGPLFQLNDIQFLSLQVLLLDKNPFMTNI